MNFEDCVYLMINLMSSYNCMTLDCVFSLPFNRRHLSCDDCLEDKSEDYQNCSVLYCVPQLYRVISIKHTHNYEQFLWVY